jgi:hypothetical protein
MEALKTRGLDSLQKRIDAAADNPMRQHVMETAKHFKTSWIELGRALYSVWRDKMYKEWGYATFDAYTSKEIGIRNQTALKLLRSYSFLEKEEPVYLKQEYSEGADTAKVPSYESVDILRLAKNNKNLDSRDYESLKKDIFDKGRDAREVKKDLTALIRERKELEPEEARSQQRLSTIRRFLGTMRALKKELEFAKYLPISITRDIEAMIKRVEDEVDDAG